MSTEYLKENEDWNNITVNACMYKKNHAFGNPTLTVNIKKNSNINSSG